MENNPFGERHTVSMAINHWWSRWLFIEIFPKFAKKVPKVD